MVIVLPSPQKRANQKLRSGSGLFGVAVRPQMVPRQASAISDQLALGK